MKKFLLLFVSVLLPLGANAAILNLTLNFDSYPGDVAWDLSDSTGSTTLDSGESYGPSLANNSLVVPIELAPDDYLFSISDAYGDGICCGEGIGSYTLSTGSLLLYSSDGQYGAGETIGFTLPAIFDLNLVFDSYPADIAWNITESASGNYVASGSGYGSALGGTTLGVPLFLAPNDYTFTITDAFGDGICCNEGAGGYSLLYNSSVFYESDGQFGFGESVDFTIPAVVPIPAALWLFGSAMAGLGWMRRKQSL